MADTDPRFSDEAGLAARLRALPQHEAAPGLWNEIALSLPMLATSANPRRRWHPYAALALAASLLVAALLPWSMHELSQPVTAQQTAAATQASADLGWLRSRSAQLETWLGKLPTAPVANGRDLMATVEVEDLIALVDLQLDATRNPGEALPLWRQRVALLEALSVLRSAPYGVADALADRSASPSTVHRL